MNDRFDFSIDWLADAALTPDQRKAWNLLRGELATMQAKNQELQELLRQAEAAQAEAEPTILARPDFNREVARMLAFDERYGGMSSVLYFDFDHIEETATRYGRSVANAAIREIGVLLMRSVRGSDILGRLAPNEFGILLMRCDNAAAWRKAEALATTLQQGLLEIHGCKLDIRVSYGAYTFRDKEDVATGLKEAAGAMTRAVK
ncbi:MAG: diguanylate cyclase [Alphaproteobacteria bacterium]|nr:diguanylate cyclase [Alphaproteobacteria bacterium]